MENDIDAEDCSKFIVSVVKYADQASYNPKRLIDTCKEQAELKQKYGDFEKIKGLWERYGVEIINQRKDISALDEQIKQRKSQLEELDERYSKMEKEINRFNDTSEKLKVIRTGHYQTSG